MHDGGWADVTDDYDIFRLALTFFLPFLPTGLPADSAPCSCPQYTSRDSDPGEV